MMKIYNTQTRNKEEFSTIEENKVRFYACGITPYDHSHLGHLVSAYRFNIIRNYLKFSGYQVTFVQNVTDIDDKIINAANIHGKKPKEISELYNSEYNASISQFGIEAPDFSPKVSEYIPQIIKYIQDLIDSGYAYATLNGNVYFDVSKKTDYGKLSNQNLSLVHEGDKGNVLGDKKTPLDFALWKNDETVGASWESPWGNGRPGWHIECSVMANTILGDQIDIHAGGLDLLFPHHENEVAQCEAHNDKSFSRFWVHGGLLNINGQKMSKSLNNFITISDAIDKYGTELIKYVILKTHYRSSINLSDTVFVENLNNVLNLYRFFERNKKVEIPSVKDSKNSVISDFTIAMDNDFNTPEAVVVMEKTIKEIENGEDVEKESLSALFQIASVFDLFKKEPKTVYGQLINFYCTYLKREKVELDFIETKIQEMHDFRMDKNYEDSDKIRDELLGFGIETMQGDNKIDWRFKIAL